MSGALIASALSLGSAKVGHGSAFRVAESAEKSLIRLFVWIVEFVKLLESGLF